MISVVVTASSHGALKIHTDVKFEVIKEKDKISF